MVVMFEEHPVWVPHLQPVGHDDNAGVLKCTKEFFSCPFLFLPVILLLELMGKENQGQRQVETSQTNVCSHSYSIPFFRDDIEAVSINKPTGPGTQWE